MIVDSPLRLNRCPEFKGIETAAMAIETAAVVLNRCPEFKGIETVMRLSGYTSMTLNRCPEFKGIETCNPTFSALAGMIESMP